ncbi:MAG: pyruvate formate lyase-activating protein [Clostridia bacterium]|nr:pyruvate formate lyase-activating protein [Clostridia bacterium]
MGAVDGPGLRYVVFMQGCPLRCIYCHNPETWNVQGKEYTVSEVFLKIQRCKSYILPGGGVTVSGGEPLMQWAFVKELFSLLRQDGIHTALDTSGIGNITGAREILNVTDLVLCDVKFSTELEYLKYTNGDMKQVLDFLKLTEEMKVPLWVRHVLVPGLTDSSENVKRISHIANGFSNLEKIELLPFKKFCEAKYDAMGIGFPLSKTEECTEDNLKRLERIL